MHEQILETIEEGKMMMDEAIEHLERELLKIRAGKASPTMLQGIGAQKGFCEAIESAWRRCQSEYA